MLRFVFAICTVVILLSLPLRGLSETTNHTFIESNMRFDVPGLKLSDALLEFGIQSHINIVVDARLLKDHSSSPVVGVFTPEQALKLLLSRAPFEFTYDAELSSIVISSKEPEAVVEKTPILIETQIDDVEELLVTGIRASLMKAMDIKFAANGIVDAITEEDIGKFPDTNLAESLQRLSGVSISYSNNEGNKINVRGLGADFNLVLLNGRHMPTADVNTTTLGFSSNDDVSSSIAVGTRSFNFADLASENIRAVEIYKNSSANRPTGGIGSVINIKTSRPFDLDANSGSIGLKLVSDTSNVEGDDITPEFSGLFSTKSEDERLGFLISGSYQARDSRSETAKMTWFKTPRLIFPDGIQPESLNLPAPYWTPGDLTYAITDYQRKRTNAQAVVQFAPTSKLTATLDYTYSDLDITSSGFDVYTRFTGHLANSDITVEDNFTVSSATEIGHNVKFSSFKSETKNINNSFGVNLDYQPTDSWNFRLDMHSSKSELRPYGVGNLAQIILVADNIHTQSYNNNFDIPVVSFEFIDQYDEAGEAAILRDEVVLNDIINNVVGTTEWATMTSKISQIQLDGEWQNSDYDAFFQQVTFGIGNEVLDNHATAEKYILDDPMAYIDAFADLYDPSLFTQESTAQYLDQFSGGFDGIPYIYNFDIEELAQSITNRLVEQRQLDNEFRNPYFSRSWAPLGNLRNKPNADNRVKETTRSAYIQLKLATNTNILASEIVAGLRYEKVLLDTSSHFAPVDDVRWAYPDSFASHYSDTKITLKKHAESDTALPSISIRTNLTDSIITRIAYSKTLTRPAMSLIRAEEIPASLPHRNARQSYQSSPELEPYTAKNYDLSIDWYYGESNYIALSFFRKQVDGYPSKQVEEKPLFGITDVYIGPRAEAVRDELIADGIEPNNTNVFNRLVELYPPEGNEIGIGGNADDPLLLYQVATAVNSEQVNIDGWEFSFQQLLWQTGFGLVFNYTHVKSDVQFGFEINDFETSLPSSSDFFNFIGFYDKHGLQVRLAYHWNDEYSTLNQPLGPIGGTYVYYTESYGQWDGLISYTWNEKLTVSLEGINITDESQRTYNTESNRLALAEQFGPRYQLGLRYSF